MVESFDHFKFIIFQQIIEEKVAKAEQEKNAKPRT